jgi:hypothetical protein
MTDNTNYDVLNRAAAREIETLIDIQSQQKQSKLLSLCDLQHFTSEKDKMWDMGGIEFKRADGARVKLASIESSVKIDNREFKKYRDALFFPIDQRQLHQSEVRDLYRTKVADQIRFAAFRNFDRCIYNSFDSTFRSSFTDAKYDIGDHTFDGDGNKEFDFTNTTDFPNGFNYKGFLKMIEKFDAKGYSDGLAFVCSERERAQLRDDITTNNDYVRSTGVIFDKFGRIEYINGVKLVVFGSETRVGAPVVGKTKNGQAGKINCFMFNTNEGGGQSAITYDLEPLNLKIEAVPDEYDVTAIKGDYKIGAIRKASAFIIRAVTNAITA